MQEVTTGIREKGINNMDRQGKTDKENETLGIDFP